MRIVSVLASGIAAAANGTATFYKRGSSAPAQWFTDFEGDDPQTLGDVVQLDAYGSATVYVNELVQVIVADSSGQQVRDFVDANAAPNTEVRSLAFTGTDYETAQQAAGNPTTLQAVLDLWKTTNQATDWKILVNGSEESITGAIASVAGAFCNVKNPDYAGGATGDGITDDKDAILAAISDCDSKGGGTVFFPAGTYRVETEIAVPYRVSLTGVGDEVSVVTIDNAANEKLFTFAGNASAEGFQEIRGLYLKSSQPNSSELIGWTDARLRVIDSRIGDGTNSTQALMVSALDGSITACRIQVLRCKLRLFGATNQCILNRATSTKTKALVKDSHFFMPDNYGGTAIQPGVAEVIGNEFNFGTINGTATCCRLIDGGVFGANRVTGTSLDVSGFSAPAAASAEKVLEYGTDMGVGTLSTVSPLVGSDTILSQTHPSNWLESIDNTASFGTNPQDWGVELLHRTSAGAQDIELNQGLEGHHYTLIVWNDTLSTITFTWTGLGVVNQANFSVDPGEVTVIPFVVMTVGALDMRPVQISDQLFMAV